MKPTRHRLIECQLSIWPDSRILTHNEARGWAYDDAAVTDEDIERAKEAWKWIKVELRSQAWYPSIIHCDAQRLANERALSTARSMICALSGDEDGVFYECGKNADGTYKWRGYRFGLEGSEYQSGFGRY